MEKAKQIGFGRMFPIHTLSLPSPSFGALPPLLGPDKQQQVLTLSGKFGIDGIPGISSQP